MARIGFQSLLYWIVGRDETQDWHGYAPEMFQSLLYWIVGRDR